MPLNGAHPIPLCHNGLNSHGNFSTLSFVRGYVQRLNSPLCLLLLYIQTRLYYVTFIVESMICSMEEVIDVEQMKAKITC